MGRDDFSSETKKRLAQRAAGRCSFPGCDVLCWLPGTEPNDTYSLGVAAHIKAASSNGPRYDESQSPEDRKDISNAIYLCQNHAHQIDQDEERFPVDKLLIFKESHESQVKGESNGTLVLPKITIEKNIGISVLANKNQNITVNDIGDIIEHRLRLTNSSDFEYKRLGFSLMYPEFIEDPVSGNYPPGYSTKIDYELKEWDVQVNGIGSVNIPEIKYHGSISFEGTSLLQGQSIELNLKSKPDPTGTDYSFTGKIPFYVSGGVSINSGTILKEYFFTIPLFYNISTREIKSGYIHVTDIEADKYIALTRAHIIQ